MAESSMFALIKGHQLFNEEELKVITKKRKDFESDLLKHNRTIKNYVEYIKYERSLLVTVLERQAASQSELKLDHIIIRNIKRIYEQGIERYPQRERFWEHHILFCIHHAQCDDGEIRSWFARYRQHHVNNPSMWLRNIRWERTRLAQADGGLFAQRTQETEVHSLLRQAIGLHPKCLELIVELLNFELCIDGCHDGGLDVRQQLAQATYRSCCASNDTIEFHVAMLAEASQHSFTSNLQADILQRMADERFLPEPLFWNTMAMRELNGLSTYKEDGTTPALAPVEMPLRHRIERCAQVFDVVVDRLPTNEMWMLYLDAMLALNEDKQIGLQPLRRRLLRRAYKRADEAGKMKEEHYVQYVEMMQDCNEDAKVMEEVLKRAVQRFSRSVSLWQVYMRVRFSTGNKESVHNIFTQACKKLARDSQPVWTLYLLFLLADPEGNAERIQSVYENATKLVCPSFDDLKVDYMEWVYRHPDAMKQTTNSDGSIETVRETFRSVVMGGTACYKMVQKMAELESLQIRPNVVDWRNAMETGTQLFGRTRIDVWIDRMKFEQLHGKPWLMSEICKEAIEQLEGTALQEAFIRDKNMLNRII